MPSYKLTYFNLTGLAEPLRLLLHYGGVSFEDVRLTKEEFIKIKESLPLKQLPTLEIDGKVIYQSQAIARYLGKQFGLAGETNWDSLEIDIVVSTIEDFRLKLAKVAFEPDAALKEKGFAAVKADVIPFYLEKLEALAKANKGHLALGKLTWVDLFFAGLVRIMGIMARTDLTAGNPNLKAVVDNVFALPAIVQYVAVRPVTDM